MRRLLLASTALVPLGLVSAAANPLGGSVVGGSATINGTGTANVTINQNTDRAVINWNSFNIGTGDKTQFIQPSTSSTVLNRVTGDTNPSQILGTLTANGRVFVTNPYGVLIGNGAVINTAGFLATSHDIRNDDFMAGRYHFNIPGRPDASVVNLGTITASNAGFAALVAPGVRNSGTITATFGKIGLASANGFSLDFYGDRLIQLGVNDSIAGNVRDVATGETLKSLVQNDGKLRANGGRVELTAVAARHVVDSVINNTGVIEARSIGHRDGRIVLGAATGGTKLASAATQTVKVSGKLDASSRRGKGGKVEIIGENIVIADATIDASGATGGGKVLIGGDIGGGKGNPYATAPLEGYAIPTATTVSINGNTVIDASARTSGDGGKVVAWADDRLSFAGTILAKGAGLGRGGFVETSANSVDVSGTINAGYGGTWLLDPADLPINAGLAATINASLNAGTDVTQQTTTTGPGNGDIIVSSQISWNTSAKLTLIAFRNIQINNSGPIAGTIVNTGGAAGKLVMRADSTGTGVGTIVMPPGTTSQRVNWTGSTGTVTVYYNPTVFGTQDNFTTGNGFINLASPSQLTQYMLVNTATNLQNISTNLAGTYALGKDINAISIPNFAPLGNISPTQFTGILDGTNLAGGRYTISNLTIAPTSGTTNVGLFGVIAATGIVRNLNITGASVTADPNTSGPGQFVGVLAGANAGTISNVSVSGTLTSGNQSGVIAGGLVGQNGIFGPGAAFGTITNASAAVNITLGNAVGLNQLNAAGGLVGSNPGTIASSSASGNITVGENGVAGGLVAQNGSFGSGGTGSIDLSSASGNVSSAGINVGLGGLVGFNSATGVIQDSFATGNVTGTGNVPECNGSSCQNASIGGLVGFNDGMIFSLRQQFMTFASGAVSVGSNGVAGGLVGFNSGFVIGAMASGPVTGAPGLSSSGNSFHGNTVLGGLIGTNAGIVANSSATGNVGAANTDRLLAGGFVGDNMGIVGLSTATGNVSAGNFSQVGGFAGTNTGSDCSGCGGMGIAANNAASILASTASGNVTVGSSSLAGGFIGAGSTTIGSSATGAVTGGANSVLGGFVGLHDFEGFIQNSTSSGPVTATGPNTWAGGFVGANIGMIFNSTTSSSVSGTSNSVLGGFAGVNVGWIDPSFASGAVQSSGGGNFIGGFVGLNFGTIDNATASGPVGGSGANNVIGGVAGANASFINLPAGLIPFSSFPTGTINNSTGPSGVSPVGVTNPTTMPTPPSLLTTCDATPCEIFRSGILGGGGSNANVPNTVLVPAYVPNLVPPKDNTNPLPVLIALTRPAPAPAPRRPAPAAARRNIPTPGRASPASRRRRSRSGSARTAWCRAACRRPARRGS